MFSPTFLRKEKGFGFDAGDAFRDKAVNIRRKSTSPNLQDKMNPPLKRGKYTFVAANSNLNNDEIIGMEEQSGSSSAMKPREKEGWKYCEYVSNRTRLRCQNMRRTGQFREFGFCEEHRGYIERIRKEGLRSKHIFDTSFEISQNYMQLISCDDDETLEPRSPTDFPFIYESMYCDSRLDDDENPLRPARVYTQEEVAGEYAKSLKRLNSSLREQRIIYKEKHIRLLQQIARIKGQPDKLMFDPLKETEKIAHLLLMRKEALKQNREIGAMKKFARMDEAAMESCSERREEWQKQMESEAGMGVQMVLDEMDKINKNNGKIEEGGIGNGDEEKEMGDNEMEMMVCARINRPYNGKRKAHSILIPTGPIQPQNQNHSPPKMDHQMPSSASGPTPPPPPIVNNSTNNKINHFNHNNNLIHQNNNKNIRSNVDHDYELPNPANWSSLPQKPIRTTPVSATAQVQAAKKNSMPLIGCIGGGTTNSYQEYLQKRHIQVRQPNPLLIGRHPHPQLPLSRNQIYGNGHQQPQMANNNKSAAPINANKKNSTRIEHSK